MAAPAPTIVMANLSSIRDLSCTTCHPSKAIHRWYAPGRGMRHNKTLHEMAMHGFGDPSTSLVDFYPDIGSLIFTNVLTSCGVADQTSCKKLGSLQAKDLAFLRLLVKPDSHEVFPFPIRGRLQPNSAGGGLTGGPCDSTDCVDLEDVSRFAISHLTKFLKGELDATNRSSSRRMQARPWMGVQLVEQEYHGGNIYHYAHDLLHYHAWMLNRHQLLPRNAGVYVVGRALLPQNASQARSSSWLDAMQFLATAGSDVPTAGTERLALHAVRLTSYAGGQSELQSLRAKAMELCQIPAKVARGSSLTFVRRRSDRSRQIYNKGAVRTALRGLAERLGLDFEEADPEQVPGRPGHGVNSGFCNQVRLFASARLLVTAHGAHLIQAIFMPKDSAVVEMHGGWCDPSPPAGGRDAVAIGRASGSYWNFATHYGRRWLSWAGCTPVQVVGHVRTTCPCDKKTLPSCAREASAEETRGCSKCAGGSSQYQAFHTSPQCQIEVHVAPLLRAVEALAVGIRTDTGWYW